MRYRVFHHIRLSLNGLCTMYTFGIIIWHNYDARCIHCTETIQGKPYMMKDHVSHCEHASNSDRIEADSMQISTAASSSSQPAVVSPNKRITAFGSDKTKIRPAQLLMLNTLLCVAFVTSMLLYQPQASLRRPKEITLAALMLRSLCTLAEQCTCNLMLGHCGCLSTNAQIDLVTVQRCSGVYIRSFVLYTSHCIVLQPV